MNNDALRDKHIESFMKLPLSERLAWAYRQRQFLIKFMNSSAKNINKSMRRNGKKYFRFPHLA